MTQNKDRKGRIRARMAQTGEPYTEAARHVDTVKAPDPRERDWKIGRRMYASRFPMSREAAAILVDREAAGLPEAPENWRSAMPHMASTYRDNGGIRRIEVLDAATDRAVATITVLYQDPDELEAGYRADMAAGPHGGEGHVSGYDLAKARLGRPDLVLHQIGWESLADWSEWPDGTWRCAARPHDRRHAVRAAPLHPGQATIGTITVVEYPGARVVADEIVTPVDPHDRQALDAALDKLGYTVDQWEVLPGRARYGAALPGHLAERDWYTEARVRIVTQHTAGAVDPPVDRTFTVGEVLKMHQSGRAGREIDRGAWWDSSDIDGAHIIPAGCAEIVEVLEDHPPAWTAAALTASQVTELLAPYHPGAAEAARAWLAAGLHVSYCHGGLAIRTPRPRTARGRRAPPRLLEGQQVHQALRGGPRRGQGLAEPGTRPPAPGPRGRRRARQHVN
jgi:hypothetical protein